MKKLVYRELKTPLTAQLEITNRCNHACIYCYNYFTSSKKRKGRELDCSQLEKVIKELGDANIFEVVFTGGEPLIRKNIIYDLAKLANKYNIDVRLNTNGSLIEEDDVHAIKESGIKNVLVSFPSCNRETFKKITNVDSFGKVVKSLELLVKNDIDVGVSMVLTRLNKDDVFDTCRFIYELGVKTFCMTPVSPCRHLNPELNVSIDDIKKSLDQLLLAKETFDIFVDTLQPLPRCMFENPAKYYQFLKRDCSAGKTTIAISPEGDVRPCTHIPISYGNILKEPLKKIWKKMKKWRDGSYVPEKCNNCAEIEICSTGCREAAYSTFGSYNADDPLAAKFPPLERKRELKKEKQMVKDKTYSLTEIKYRKEGNKFIIYSRTTHSIEIINEDFFKFIVYLKKKGKFSLRLFENNPLYWNAIKFLNDRGFIKENGS